MKCIAPQWPVAVRCAGNNMSDIVSEIDKIEKAAQLLRGAEQSATPISPVRDLFEDTPSPDIGQKIKQCNHQFWKASRQRSGVKTAMTSKVIQEIFALEQSDYGYLYKDRELKNGATLSLVKMIAPKLEVEFALRLKNDWVKENGSIDAFVKNIECVFLAFEIVDSRIEGWNIQGLDAIADNAASGCYLLDDRVLAVPPQQLLELPVSLARNGEELHKGCAKDSLGDPIAHALELANRCCHHDQPLAAGEIILCGAILPLTEINADDAFEAQAGDTKIFLTFTD